MKFNKTNIEGLLVLEPTVHKDDRGHFWEFFNTKQFNDHGINVEFVQDNLSLSKKGVIRGLHFQEAPYEQGKLVSVASGKVISLVGESKNCSVFKKKSFS